MDDSSAAHRSGVCRDHEAMPRGAGQRAYGTGGELGPPQMVRKSPRQCCSRGAQLRHARARSGGCALASDRSARRPVRVSAAPPVQSEAQPEDLTLPLVERREQPVDLVRQQAATVILEGRFGQAVSTTSASSASPSSRRARRVKGAWHGSATPGSACPGSSTSALSSVSVAGRRA